MLLHMAVAPRRSIAMAAWALISSMMLARGAIATGSAQVRGNQKTFSVAMMDNLERGDAVNLPIARHSHAPVRRLRRAETSGELSVKAAAEPEKHSRQMDTLSKSKAVNETNQEKPGTAYREALSQISQGVLKAVPMQLLMKMRSHSQISQAPEVNEPPGTPAAVLNVGQFLMLGVLTLLFAYYYKTHKANIMDYIGLHSTEQDKLLLEKKGFAFSLFACCDEPKLCLFTCCCAPVRWADTLRMVGMLSMVTGVCVFLGTELLGYVLPGGALIVIAVLTYCRQELRAKFDMPHSTCMTCVEDCCTYWWCGLCAITQEARQVELAAKVGHPAIVKE